MRPQGKEDGGGRFIFFVSKAIPSERAWIGTANERHSSKLARFISNYYSTPYRSMRIHEFMNEKEKLSKKDFQLMHNDTKVLIFQEWKPILEKIDSKKLNNIEKRRLCKNCSHGMALLTKKINRPPPSSLPCGRTY